ncbi:hypothetical protein [Azospirillum sp. INR13]|uniref:hypothetical protein n=1 Tax=Azospirillum sp. INR13 TaxID=2596919 RepID=UPI002106DA23|nr:hypothetical protein [Azospirillum sp. INR13]
MLLLLPDPAGAAVDGIEVGAGEDRRQGGMSGPAGHGIEQLDDLDGDGDGAFGLGLGAEIDGLLLRQPELGGGATSSVILPHGAANSAKPLQSVAVPLDQLADIAGSSEAQRLGQAQIQNAWLAVDGDIDVGR